jgi:NADPH-dependent 2,4-dienoyl-CoA reductase/sulfur reductase-like enzyme
MMRLLIIGASDAGISAGLRAKELEPETEVSLLEAGSYPNFSICGLPYFLSGEVQPWERLAHRSEAELAAPGLRLFLRTRAAALLPEERQVRSEDGRLFSYDKLIIATGGRSRRLAIPGVDLPGVFSLRWMEDAFAIEEYVRSEQPARALLLGGGYIGMEMAEALTLRGIRVSVLEHHPTLMKTLDAPLGAELAACLSAKGLGVHTGLRAERIEKEKGGLRLVADGFEALADMILVAVGSEPESSLAAAAGIECAANGAICVNRQMETSLPGIYAAGDCAQTWHALLRRDTYLPLGSTSHKQGRVAGAAALGRPAAFAGTYGTQVVKIFDRVAGRTGLREEEARAAGWDPFTVASSHWDHKAYYPGATRLELRLTGDRRSGRLLGAQMLGERGAEIAKRLDVLAAALASELRVEQLSDLDLSYTPPLSSPWDPLQAAAQAWERELRREASLSV